jgi:hypothetical protein
MRRNKSFDPLGLPVDEHQLYSDALSTDTGARLSIYSGIKGEREGENVADVTYVSRVRVEPVEGRIRRAYVPGEEEPVFFGVHDEVAEHYGVSPDEVEPHASTLDYVVAAAGG